MTENQRQRAMIEQQVQDYLAAGGTIERVPGFQGRVWNERTVSRKTDTDCYWDDTKAPVYVNGVKHYRVGRVAQMTGLAPSTLGKLTRTGDFPQSTRGKGGIHLWPAVEVKAWLSKQ